MNSGADGNRVPETCPYGDLYIYYLEGRVATGRTDWGAGFLGNWQEGDSSFLFFGRPADERVASLARTSPRLRLIDRYRMRYEEWQGAPEVLAVGRFRIAPPWHALPDAEGHLDLRIDPGVVFGNGAHATTRNCLSALDRVCRRTVPETVLDLGTGTGVLALAAARAGSRRVLAVDLNHLAVATARDNIRRNRLERRVLAVQARAEDLAAVEADLVLANIHFAVARQLIESVTWRPGKWFVLSGLLRSEAREATDRLAGKGLRIVTTWQHEGIWHTVLARGR